MAKRIVIFSTKGGVGKTFVATNLAVSLVQDEAQRVCLIDFDVHAPGDMARMLNLNPTKSVSDLMAMLKAHPQTLKKEEFIHKTQFGIDFLPGVLRPQQASHFDPELLKDALNFLDKDYDYIIIDAGKNLSNIFVSLLNQANLILLIATPDLVAIYQTKWILDTLQSLGFPMAMIQCVLNRAESVSGISWQEVKVNLPVNIIANIPSEGRVVGLALNRAVPVVIDNPRSKVALALKALSNLFVAKKDMFLEHKELDELKLKELPIEKAGGFWSQAGLAEAPPSIEGELTDEKEDEIVYLKKRIHSRLIEQLNIKRLDLRVFSDNKLSKDLKERASIMVTNLIAEEAGSFISSEQLRKKLVKEIVDEALGLGALEDLIADHEVTDIMVNNKNEIYVERHGKIELTAKKFISNEQVKTIIERIIAPIGRHIDESVPMVDARLADGSRVNAIIPPLSLTGPTLTIRKFRKERFKIEELIAMGAMTRPMADFIQGCVLLRKNMIVSGGTGSGKTTILNVLSSFIPEDERIITIEDAAELKLNQTHWVRLESRPANIEGKGAIAIRDLFRNTLRMRPDRIVIGECRGGEALDMLQAMNTGHDGSMTTLHANSTQDVVTRMDSLILMSGIELPLRAIREMVSSAIHVIVHTARLSDGSRKITQITELAGMSADESHINLKDIFLFKQKGIDDQGKIIGEFRPTGYIPTFYEDFKIKGINIPESIFKA